ncbi:uncharacterized protein DNG_05137 [Cephalotrichum gorgonifer]|uniref:non-specific serine/threonine protein kinase n=1 Tax=Cephalotrichum gorgonifer TaxID=2041049 RepID=A0AAE8MZ64_9PEZI|nr:uncharacterized protein DNG_05137 [Cephalotrichum gorgonifer]
MKLLGQQLFHLVACCLPAAIAMKDILVNGIYHIDRKIGEGGFGLVYSENDTRSDDEIALKLTPIGDDPRMLEDEANIYRALAGGREIPRVLWFGQECDYYVLIYEILGPSLEDLFNYCSRKFSLKTVLLIANQAITRIEYIHSRGVLHRDIKPDNFLTGVSRQGNTLYTIDFGLAKEFSRAEADRKYEGRGFGGTKQS